MRRLTLKWDRNNREIAQAIDSFERRRYVARQLVPPGYERHFQDQARFLSVHTSTAIEGNVLDEREAQLVMIHGSSGQPNEQEAKNCEDAYVLLQELAADPHLQIDQGLIRVLNSIMQKDLPGEEASERGKYRTTGCIIQDSATREIRYQAPPPEWIPSLMDSLVEDLRSWRDVDHPLVAAAKVHFALISIHPFRDGNGRTARLLEDLVLWMGGMAADGMVSVNGNLLSRRQEYYDKLRSVQGREFQESVDITEFILFTVQMLNEAVNRLEAKAIDFCKRKDNLEKISEGMLDPRQVVGIMYMLDLEPVSTAVYARLNRCSIPTARSDLKRLLSIGFIQRVGDGKQTRYAWLPPSPESEVA
ncbi:MAG: Fic family protein [Chloroflexota bacterium]|nr:Fic family protein [Chloroflexota bacterium]